MTVLQLPLGRAARARHRARAAPPARRLPRRRAWPPASSPSGLDVGVVASDEPDTVSAARFTTNARLGAPVIVSREAALDRLRAVAANSGCSNVGDGQRGLDTAVAMQAAAAEELGIEPSQVAVASTGVIGAELPREKVVSGVRAACGALGRRRATPSRRRSSRATPGRSAPASRSRSRPAPSASPPRPRARA